MNQTALLRRLTGTQRMEQAFQLSDFVMKLAKLNIKAALGKKATKKKSYLNCGRDCATEDLILTKLLWCKKFRSERHLRDCAGIWQIQKDKIDINYLSHWAEKLAVKNLL